MRTPRAHRWMHELICYVLFRYEPAPVLYMYQDINSFEWSRFVVIPWAVIRISVMLSGYYELLTSSVSLSITSEVTTLWQDRSAFELRFITIWRSKDRTAAYCKWQNSIYFYFVFLSLSSSPLYSHKFCSTVRSSSQREYYFIDDCGIREFDR